MAVDPISSIGNIPDNYSVILDETLVYDRHVADAASSATWRVKIVRVQSDLMASRTPSDRLSPTSDPHSEGGRTTSATRLDSVARARNWTWPVVSAILSTAGVTIVAPISRNT